MRPESAAVLGRAPLAPSLARACRRWADRPAITFQDTALTYAQLWDRVRRLAAAYQRMGVRRGDRILCQLRNGPDHVAAIAAAWQLGAVHVGADNDLTGPELSRIAQRLDAAVLLFQPPDGSVDPFAPLDQVRQRSPSTRVLVQGDTPGSDESLADLPPAPDTFKATPTGPLDDALVFLTSGTTGEPKGVVETLSAHWAKVQLFTDACAPGPDDVHLLSLPVAHVFGLRLAMMALLRGGRLILLDRFSADRTLDLIEQERVTVLPAVPTHLRLLHQRIDPSRHDVSSLRWVLSAASALPQPLARWVLEGLHARMLFVYGCSEGFTTVTTDTATILDGSVGNTVFRGPLGTPANGTVQVVDPDTRVPMPTGERGEIVFGAMLPVRYWDQPPVATDGWYRTGDLGHLGRHGEVHIVGRLKQLINRGGLHVSSTEVEVALLRHQDVADAAVIPVADPVLGEAVCACVVAAGHRVPDLDEVRTFLRGSLARHKLPDQLCIVDAVPHTAVGKVDRPALADMVAAPGAHRERARQ